MGDLIDEIFAQKRIHKGQFVKGHKTNVGRKQSKETIEKRRLKLPKGKDNIKWKGNKAGLSAIHQWIAKNKLKPKFCEDCKKVPPLDLANISGKYKRDVKDYKYLCRKCHQKFDGTLNKTHKFNKEHPELFKRGKDGRFVR